MINVSYCCINFTMTCMRVLILFVINILDNKRLQSSILRLVSDVDNESRLWVDIKKSKKSQYFKTKIGKNLERN